LFYIFKTKIKFKGIQNLNLYRLIKYPDTKENYLK
jgi:hypothetical protein